MPKRVFLIRHGETEGSAGGRFVGSRDIPLTERGKSQVTRLPELLPAGVLAEGAETTCIASPLVRARQTAEAVAVPAGLEIEVDPDLREICFGDFEGLTAAEVDERFPGALESLASPARDAVFPGGDSLREFYQRMARMARRIVADQAEAVLVFAHGGVIRGLACALLGLGQDRFWLLDVHPASVVRIDLYDGGASLSGLWSVDDLARG